MSLGEKRTRFPLPLSMIVDSRKKTLRHNHFIKVHPSAGLTQSFLPAMEGARRAMVWRLMKQCVTDERVLSAMQTIPRHLFVDPSFASRTYEDTALSIGCQQIILKYFIVSHMIEQVRRRRTFERVLEIGVGCEYQAVVLLRVARN